MSPTLSRIEWVLDYHWTLIAFRLHDDSSCSGLGCGSETRRFNASLDLSGPQLLLELCPYMSSPDSVKRSSFTYLCVVIYLLNTLAEL